MLLACGAGCASSGTLQPHQAFRQATTPYQGYYQGAPPAYGTSGNFNAGSASDYSEYGGYNNSLPGYGQPNPVAGGYEAYGNPFASSYGNSTAGQAPVQGQGGYGQYSYPANAGYNYQPAYSGGFTSGSC